MQKMKAEVAASLFAEAEKVHVHYSVSHNVLVPYEAYGLAVLIWNPPLCID